MFQRRQAATCATPSRQSHDLAEADVYPHTALLAFMQLQSARKTLPL
jgi:hypothetical protein